MPTEAIRSESETTSTATCVSISARELHELLLRMHAAANIAQRRFIDGLRAFSEQKLYLELGFPNITAYAERTFRFKKSQVYEFMRVSEALVTLPAIASAFEQGELSFSFTAELTRVASGETEAEWLEFARTRRVAVTLAEVKDALRKNRKLPRLGSYGLPGLPRILKLELAPEEHAIVERGLAKIADEMASGLDGTRPEPEKVLVYLMDRVLQGAQPWGAGGEGSREGKQPESPYGLTFVCCPECHRAAVETPEGRVEVPLEAVERLTGSAECVAIDPERERPPEAKGDGSAPRKRVPKSERDRPNDARLRKELRARAGGRCENPYCRRPTNGGGHAHHIELRSEGGRTAPWNGAHVCERCHSLIHSGSLVVSGDPINGLQWTTRAEDIERRVRKELAEARALPQVRVVEASLFSGCPENDSGCPENSEGEFGPIPRDAILALEKLGCTRSSAVQRATRAWERMKPTGEVDVGRLVVEALRN